MWSLSGRSGSWHRILPNELGAKIGEESGEEAEDVIVLSNREYELDLAQFIYEYISVIIPLRNVHEDENGNRIVIRNSERAGETSLAWRGRREATIWIQGGMDWRE